LQPTKKILASLAKLKKLKWLRIDFHYITEKLDNLFPMISRLHILEVSKLNKQQLELLFYQPTEIIDLSLKSIEDFDDHALLTVAKQCPKLEQFLCKEDRGLTSDFKQIFQFLPQLKTFICDDGFNADEIVDDETIAAIVKNCLFIEEFSLGHTSISVHTLTLLQQCKHLKTLDICCCKISLTAVIEFLSKNKNIMKLILTIPENTNEWLEEQIKPYRNRIEIEYSDLSDD
jgi:hypothetical protein